MTDNPMRIVITGAGGRMGQALIAAVHAAPGMVVAGAVEREGAEVLGRDAGELAGLGPLGVTVSDDPLPVFAKADAVLDFTAPAATVTFAGYAAQARIAHIIGTTGLSGEDEAAVGAAARHTPIVKSGNMSLGVNLIAVLVEQAARALEAANWDIEVLEMHHRHKVDAPSGTALLLGEAAAAGRAIALADNAVRVRDGQTGARPSGSVGFATLRGGSVIGDHSVLFAGDGEMVEIRHQALDRALFAKGAVRAALWAREHKPGLYSMRDVLGL